MFMRFFFCDGLKFNIFLYYKFLIEWLERFDCDGEKIVSEGYVFWVRIEKKEYVIKVVSEFLISFYVRNIN